jgi:tetratricopeptide (TPR) repeat protein
VTTNRISFPELAAYCEPEHPLAGRYLIERDIGAGGMAFVFAARDLKHGRVVAVKVLRSEYGSTLNAERFTREIQIAAGLTHPNILPVHDSGSADGLLYYVMPYIEGGTLVDRMKREERLSLGEIRRITREVGAALQFAHSHGIIHRDIKPANVLLAGGVAVVADFGLARAIEHDSLDNKLTQVGMGVGTPAYMSPEQGAGESDIDARTDQYSLACLVYEMLAGRPPFTGPSYQKLLAQHISDSPPLLRTVRSEVPQAVEAAIAKALSKRKEDRFTSVEDFLRALDGDVKGQTASWGVRRNPLVGMRAAIIAAVAIVVIAAVVVNYKFGRMPGAPRPLDANLVAVAPFTVFGNANREWREGLVDVLARDFDGAGPLRTVSPSLIMRRATGTVDRAGAISLAKSTGAGVVVFGQLLEAGATGDSVRARVTIADASKDSVIGELEVMNSTTRMDLVADSIALRALRQLGTGRSIAAVPRAYFGSRSLPALKQFLQGEQQYRRNDFEAARTNYEKAIALDSGFALAYRRMRGVLRGISGEFDSTSLWFAARAGAANHGSTPRDSLLILADSLAAVHRLAPAFADGKWIGSIRRRLAVLEEASRRYPEDPEVWSELGEARVHYGDRVGVDDRAALAAFERALQKDSAYGPAFYHAIDLTLQTGNPTAARALVDRYFQLNPHDTAFRLVTGVLRGDLPKRLFAQFDSVRSNIASALQLLSHYPDPTDLGSALYAHWIESEPGVIPLRRAVLARRYAFRGRLSDASLVLDDSLARFTTDGPGLILAFAQWGAVSAARADSIFGHTLRDGDLASLPIADLWWAARSDTAALAASRAAARRRVTDPSPEVRGLATYAEAVAIAMSRLANADTAGAIGELRGVADSSIQRTAAPIRILTATLLMAKQRYGEAAVYLDARPPFAGAATVWDVEWRLVRAQAAQRLGDSATARRNYQAVIAAWSGSDQRLHRELDDARKSLRELGGRS